MTVWKQSSSVAPKTSGRNSTTNLQMGTRVSTLSGLPPLVLAALTLGTNWCIALHAIEPVIPTRWNVLSGRGTGLVEKIKVLVANRPRLMRELVLETISAQPDIEVMAEIQDDSMIAQLVEELHPDCLIIALDQSDNRPDICDSLLERYPHLRILALASERNTSIFYWATLSIRSNRVETSEQGILNALRGRVPVASVTTFPTGGQKVN